MASAVTSSVSPLVESPTSDFMNGHFSRPRSDTLRNRATFARAEDVFPKKRSTLHESWDELKPHFGAPPKVEAAPREFPRISKPVELLKPEYDVVVIGSGYGGGVAASRMARARQSVCVLELGREKWPGEYPDTVGKAWSQLHVSGDFVPHDNTPGTLSEGDPTSLYHLILGEGQNAFVANGLGGTSLLNANVYIEADHRTLKTSPWPKEIREDPSCLDKYYRRAREVLEPQPYPKDWPRLPKMEMLRKQAEALGLEDKFHEVNQTTRFEDGLNSCGVRMNKSTLSGMDTTGVNDGSKSSTLVNYLADAWNWGAEIFCGCEVRYIIKHPKEEGYLIFFAWHGCRRNKFKDVFYQDLMWVHAKKFVFLGAGALGSTEILLRSKEMGLKMSKKVGENMSGNGDMLAFGYNMNDTVRALGKPNPPPNEPVGPTIASIIDCRDQEDALDGFVIEEGAIPQPLVPLMQTMLELTPHRVGPRGLRRSKRFKRILAGAVSRFGYYNVHGSLEKTAVYLIMSHDDNQAVLSLKNNKPYLQFRDVGRANHVRALNAKLAQATSQFEGTFVENPFSALFGQEITVHPIGGASMSNDDTVEGGVTNHLGEVFTGEEPGQVHEGLAVVDGSVIPTALGANPFATITAIAERTVEKLAERHGLSIDYDTKNGELNLFGEPEHPLPELHINKDVKFVKESLTSKKHGLEFTEIMEGHIHIGQYIEEYEVAERLAKGHCEAARFFLSVHAYDMETLLSSKDHRAMLTGTFTSGALPASPYMVTSGDFQLFTDDPNTPDAKNLVYDFEMKGTDRSLLHFRGYKIISDVVTFSVPGTWKATTTLMVTLTDPSKPKHENIIGRGILHIDPFNLIHELRTFYASIHSAKKFLAYFIKELAHVFFAPFDLLDWPQFHYDNWVLKNEPERIFQIQASDGVHSVMKLWEPFPDAKAKKRNMDLLFLPGAAVDESIFALNTIDVNAITYFRRLGYRCFCVVHRVGKTHLAKKGWTTYDARLDVAAALDKIQALRESRERPGRKPYPALGTEKTYIVAHCAGSVALSMGLLDGTVETSSIAGITVSQVFMHPNFATVNRLKAGSPIPLPGVYSLLSRSNWFDCTSTPTDTFVQLGLNQLLRFYPPPSRGDICNSVVCHRSSLVFGMLWKHSNLNPETHKSLEKIVGGTSMRSLKHLMAMGMQGKVLDSKGKDNLITPENLERLRGIPMYLFSGMENSVYDPVTTMDSFDLLRTELGEEFYKLDKIPNYGHLDCWMGPKAYKVVYPRVEKHIEKVAKYVAEGGVNGFNGVKATNGHAH